MLTNKGATGPLIKIAFRNIWRNKRRTGFCVSAVAIGAFFFVFFFSLDDGITRGLYDTIQIFELGHIRVVSSQYEEEREAMPVWHPVADGKSWEELAASIQEIPGVHRVFPRISTLATLQESTIKHATVLGLDMENEMAANHFNLVRRNDGLVEGEWPRPGSNECAVGFIFARKTGLGIGDRIPMRTMSAQFSDRFWSPVITGIFNFDFFMFDERAILTDFQRLQRLLVLDEGTQQLMIFLDDENSSPHIAASVRNILGEDSVVSDWKDSYWIAMQKVNELIYLVAYLVFLIVASFLIINTIVMIIHERVREIGMMGSLGMTRAEIVRVFFFESLFLAAIGASLGVGLGGMITFILSHFPINLNDFYGNSLSSMPISNTIFFQFSFARLFTAWIVAVLVASVFTIIPSLKSAFVEPAEALRR